MADNSSQGSSEPVAMTDYERHLDEKMAKELIERYTTLRQGIMRQYRMNAVDIPYFMKLAHKLRTNKINPRIFLELQFKRVKPYPTAILLNGPRAFDAYVAYKARWRVDETVKLKLHLQNEAVKVQVKNGKDMRTVLLSPTMELDPAFRCCMANSAGLADVAAQYEAAAIEFLICHPEYYYPLREFVPASIKELLDKEFDGEPNDSR